MTADKEIKKTPPHPEEEKKGKAKDTPKEEELVCYYK